ncbi:MAG: hypothetical protein N4A33_03045 [Bacteriovoracaceae bacterium]|jgi:hypothetical protein|nr:hypothetical protein [Bacteriovoracaceae bacterium]
MKYFYLLLLFCSTLYAGLPNIRLYFEGALGQSCSFVDNQEVVSSLESTLSVLNQIQENEVVCQNLLVNARAFIDSSLAITEQFEQNKFIARSNVEVVENMISTTISSSLGYNGQYELELLEAKKDLALYNNQEEVKRRSLVQTLQLGTSLFTDLTNAPVSCSHSFGQDILAPSVSVAGQLLNSVNPAIGSASNLLSSIITYADRVMKPSFRSYRKLIQASNFHQSYKCAAKNIEKVICDLERSEKTKTSSQSDQYNDFLDKYKEKILSYDDENESFRKYFHMLRHRYRISKIIEDLDNIYRSPETAQDLKTVVGYQTYFTRLSLMPRLNPLRNKDYVQRMIDADLASPDLVYNWENWNNNLESWPNWYSSIRADNILVNLIKRNCQTIDLKKYPKLTGVYNAATDDCQAYGMRQEEQISQFIQAVINPALVFIQQELRRLNDKIRLNSNIHALYTNILNQMSNTGNDDYNEYTLDKLLDLYKNHANLNLNTSLKLFAVDMKDIVGAILKLVESESLNNRNFDEFVEATKEAYALIAKVSNNGLEGGILYRSIVESKITAYLDGVYDNYVFHRDDKLAQKFVSFIFHANQFQDFINNNERSDASGSSNIALMNNVKDAFYATFSKVVAKIMNDNFKKFKQNKFLKRNLIHSCAIFYPMMSKHFKAKRLAKKCYALLNKQNGIHLYLNSKEKFPVKTFEGLTFQDRCYYNQYEFGVIKHRMNLAKRNKRYNRI